MRTTELTAPDPEHPASGTVILDGRTVRLENVSISEAPDGRVVLTNDHDESTGVKIAPLKGFTGSHSYDIPDSVNPDDYDSVTIWCDKFSVPIGLAKF